MSAPDSDKIIQVNKPTTFPIDLAPQKVTAMVKPQDVKGGTVQTQQTFRTIGQPQQMRMITVPAGTVQNSGGTQIIQTHLMPQMLKQGIYRKENKSRILIFKHFSRFRSNSNYSSPSSYYNANFNFCFETANTNHFYTARNYNGGSKR